MKNIIIIVAAIKKLKLIGSMFYFVVNQNNVIVQYVFLHLHFVRWSNATAFELYQAERTVKNPNVSETTVNNHTHRVRTGVCSISVKCDTQHKNWDVLTHVHLKKYVVFTTKQNGNMWPVVKFSKNYQIYASLIFLKFTLGLNLTELLCYKSDL